VDFLKNDSLEVSIIDPVADQDRLGWRYCTGGYIWQVTDSKLGELMSGPVYPDVPGAYDGQGMPDSFFSIPLRDIGSTDSRGLIVGVGVCDLGTKEVLEFCNWQVEQTDNRICMTTTQAFGGYEFELERTVILSGRTVRSQTKINNRMAKALPISWFPHPFFPHPKGNELCKLNLPAELPEGRGYELADSGFICRKDWAPTEGYYAPLEFETGKGLVILQKHPLLGLVAGRCSYVPGLFPIWGNCNTFSWEPYFERTAARGQSLDWWIEYDF